jgi:peptidoglycan-associated lipoprotein
MSCGGKRVPVGGSIRPPMPDTSGQNTKPAIASFTAEPGAIEAGQSAILRWSTAGATDMNIDPDIGAVQSSGSRSVSPLSTTTYQLSVSGPGGADSKMATVEVRRMAPPSDDGGSGSGRGVGRDSRPAVIRLTQDSQDAFFNYDSNELRPDARDALTKNAALLKSIFAAAPDFHVIVEGHCDERGSAEYNLGLGDRRAAAAKEFLVELGVSADKLQIVSYGKDKPQCTDANEGCYQKNRRAHLAPVQ